MAKRYADVDGKDKRDAKQLPLLGGWDAKFRGYLNLNLTDEQKAQFPAWFEGSSFWEMFNSFVEDGVNISVKWVAKEGCYLASGTQRREASPNAGLVVTARGRGADIALGRLAFVLTILSHTERWEDTQPMADSDRW